MRKLPAQSGHYGDELTADSQTLGGVVKFHRFASEDHKSIDPSSRNKKNSRTMRELFSKVVKGLKLISKECEGRNEDETLKATLFIYSTALLLCRLLLDSPAILSGDIFSLARRRSSHLRILISEMFADHQ